MNKNFTNVIIGRVAAFAVIFTLLAVPAVEARGRNRRHHGISEGRRNTLLAIGTGLALLDIATRPKVEQTTIVTTPVYTAPVTETTTTTYYTTPGVTTYQQTTYTPVVEIPAPRVTYNIYGGSRRPAVVHRHHGHKPQKHYAPRGKNDHHDRKPAHHRGGKPGVHHRR